ncbi:uncharacterized protein LOC117174934 [Belonocnema kinseyi]|uniref:uncharacterized protein LOC117174934 n=1 Tax=Belonocnema kinseyi TaxID=2817044 RepID=UPI00143D74AE|nr:uncharacterized protein LOC117174934 [Belonocnema kinseyi]
MDYKLYALFVLVFLANFGSAGPIAAGIGYAGCAALACACFAVAGFTFGTVTIATILASPALTACNVAFAKCEAAVMAMLVAPTP